MKAINPNAQKQTGVSAEELFTDREAPREAFWNTYNTIQPGDVEVLSFYGVGGIGKSALLKKLGKEIEEKIENGKLDYVYYSFESEPTKAEFLFSLSRKMIMRNKSFKLQFPLFDAAIKKIEEEGNKEISYLKDTGANAFSTEAAEMLPSIVGDIVTEAAGGALPFGNTLISILKFGTDAVNRRRANKLAKSGQYKQDFEDIAYKDSKTIIENLHEYFRKDAFEAFSNRKDPMIILLDGYEHFVNRLKDGSKSEYFDSWMYGDNDGLIFLPNTIWVIAGRNKLHWPAEVLPEEHTHRIGNLSQEDTIGFLNKAGLSDQTLNEQLYKLTNGTPAFIDLCITTYNHLVSAQYQPEISDFGDNVDSLAGRFLENMDLNKQRILEMISFLPNVWDIEMAIEIAARLGYGNIMISLTEELLPLSIFEKENEGYRLHETVRVVIRKKASNADIINKTILMYYKELVFDNTSKYSTIRIIELFCKYLDRYASECEVSSALVSENDIMRIKAILEKEKDRTSDYWFCDKLISALIDFCEKSNFSPEVIISCKNMRNFNMYYMGRYKEGFEPAKETWEYAIKVLGDKHPETLSSLYNLASSYNDQGNDKMAATLYEQCLELRVELFGEKNVDVVRTMNNLAFAYENLAEKNVNKEYINKAFELRKKCYAIRVEISGEHDQNTLKCMNNLGISYSLLGMYEEAYAIRKKCYEIRLAKFGKHHLDTLNSMYSVAESEREMGNYSIAQGLYQEGYELRRRMYGSTNPKTLEGMIGYAQNTFALGRYEEGIAMLQQCYEDSMKVLSEGHIFTERCARFLDELKAQMNAKN